MLLQVQEVLSPRCPEAAAGKHHDPAIFQCSQHSHKLCGMQVNEHFQVEGHSNWFAVGDCTNIPDWKMGLQVSASAACALQTVLC